VSVIENRSEMDDSHHGNLSLPSSSTSKRSPKKSPKKRELIRGETVGGGDDGSESGMSSGGCLSQPSSPSLSGRLGRVTRMISRSDANLVHSLKVRWVCLIYPSLSVYVELNMHVK